MRTIKQLTDNRFLNIKEVADSDMHVKAYQFAERKGIDSIAFICVKFGEMSMEDGSYDLRFLLNHECTPPTGEFLNRAFGGSIDKDKTYEGIVIDEVREEAGYKVDEAHVYTLGNVFVSTQMNQYCYLFLVEIDDSMKVEREPENACEATSTPIWMTENNIIGGSDWKAITIIQKARWNGFIP